MNGTTAAGPNRVRSLIHANGQPWEKPLEEEARYFRCASTHAGDASDRIVKRVFDVFVFLAAAADPHAPSCIELGWRAEQLFHKKLYSASGTKPFL